MAKEGHLNKAKDHICNQGHVLACFTLNITILMAFTLDGL